MISCTQPDWIPYALPGCWCYQGSFGERRTTPKRCLRGAGIHQEGRKISRRKQDAKAAPWLGITESGGEGPTCFVQLMFPRGGVLGKFPSWSGSGCGKRGVVCPLCLEICPEKAIKGGKERCLLCFLIEAACAVPGQPADHCTGGFLKWPLGTKLNLLRPDAAEEMDEKAEGNLQREH